MRTSRTKHSTSCEAFPAGQRCASKLRGVPNGAAGNRTSLTDNVGGTSRTFSWGYDNLYRLTNETVSGASPTGWLGYGYDDVGNRTNRTGTLGSLTASSNTFDVNDWLDNDGTTNNANPWFDANGNMRTNGSVYYGYDWANRLVAYTNGSTVVTMVYDADGNRVRKTVGSTNTYYLVAAVNPTGYPQVVEEVTVTGGTTNLSKVYSYGRALISQRQPGVSTNFFICDGHGSTRLLADTGGNILNAFAYDAYGMLISSNGPPQSAYLYCGEQWDTDLNVYYLRARYFNPGTGRFWTMDTYEGDQEDPLSFHLYNYCEGNPVDNIDPDGHDMLEVLSVVSITSILVVGCDQHTPSPTKAVQPALITGGSPASLAKRKKIDEIARKYNGSHLWDYAVRKDNFPPDSNKCNKFVYDVTKEAGAEALVTVGRTKRAPLAAEYADRNTAIPNWRPLAAGERPQPGDIAAYRLSGGGTEFSGHSGLIVIGGSMSAHDDGVYGKPGQFENNADTRYRRYTGN